MHAVQKSLAIRRSVGALSQLIPVLFIEGNHSQASVSFEALSWAAEMLGLSLESVRHAPIRTNQEVTKRISTLARFVCFIGAAFDRVAIDAHKIDYTVTAYCLCRHTGTHEGDTPIPLRVLDWKAAKAGTVREEFGHIREYFAYCVLRFGHIGPLCTQVDESGYRTALKRLDDLGRVGERDFFVHLAARREYWTRLEGGRPPIPLPAYVLRVSEPIVARPAMPREEVAAIVRAERNPAFQALWLAGAFGGLRISEQLNSWQTDHRPGQDRALFFGTNEPDPLPLYIRAHPSESTFVDHPSKNEGSRREHLASKFDLSPRTLLSPDDPYYAGWKGTVSYGPRLTHQVMWSDPWAANLFAELVGELFEFHRRHRTAKRHPWFFVNVDRRAGDYYGLPIKIDRASKAFDAAVKRVRLRPHQWSRSLHGLRHFYKSVLENELGMSDRAIQVAMGHSSIRSQDAYARQMRQATQELRSGMGRIMEVSRR